MHRLLAHGFSIAVLVCAVVFFVFSKVMPVSLLNFVISQLRILQIWVRNLDGDTNDLAAKKKLPLEIARTMVIRRILKRHQQIIR